ncbi:Fe-S protein assembly co-chaperone HscB protein [Besnoitia besnoiti]|uniref:Fe-S protein assembly co-chaperone HscB protein n=1 Tax=Besnoitia besnoiti TaxID=94643 RepID=A0A2A9M9X9_BESBE|nr:Fe-S protein assembly co-chaperone HscB protein [Besnoitia besnoiti]PFH32182.1 Fe-S protein assembly co-chaperone HscB protein [Besnoitia besnoiti]
MDVQRPREPESGSVFGCEFLVTQSLFQPRSTPFVAFSQRTFCSAHSGQPSEYGSSAAAARTKGKAGPGEPLRHDLTETEVTCPCCGALAGQKHQIFCESCGDVLEPRYDDNAENGGLSYFDLLELSPVFDVDRAALDAKYKQLEKRLHPDRHPHADQTYHDRLEKHRMKVIEAVNTIKNPARRALHLLAHHCGAPQPPLEEGAEGDRVTDMDLLMEVFELNEALEAVVSREQLEDFKRRVDHLLAEDEKSLASRFQEQNFDEIQRLIHRYQMHARLQDSITNWSPPE